ncbi:MAG: hypothetical protein ACFFFT_17060 [Candidatus Thorarchaeota archaeon]
MAKKSGSKKDLQNLIIFGHKGGPKSEKTDEFFVEKADKTDKIKITNSLSTQGTHYRYSISLNNENSVSIADIKISVFYPKFLTFTGSYPLSTIISSSIEDEKEKSNVINIGLKGLKGKSSVQIYLHFTPSTQLNFGEIKTFLKYINNEGKEKIINTNSINIQIDDMVIIPKIISHSRIREISQIPGMKRALISLGIGTSKKVNFKKIFRIFENLVLSYDFQFITKDKEKGILWFFGFETKSSNDILSLCKIGSNVIEIIAYSTNPIILGLFLFSFTKNLKEHLSMYKVIQPKVKIFELDCVNCGESLPYFPKKDESITCIKCSHTQIVW